MNRLEELSKISNAVLTPHLNFNPAHKSKSVNFAGSQYGGELTEYEKAFRKRWCERQMKKIGYYGAVLSCGKVIEFNVIPLNDIKEHVPNNQCWCNPDYDDGVYIHHSLDNRELTEELAKS